MIKKFTLVLAASLFTFASINAATITTNILIKGSKSFEINMSNWKTETVDIKIIDDAGVVIYSEEETTENNKRYSLKNLPSGAYTVEVSNELKTVENKLLITKEGVTMELESEVTYNPIFNISDSQIDINYLNEGKNVTMIISNKLGVVYETKLEGNSINKRFNIADLPSDEYTIYLSNAQGSFSKVFTK